MKTKALLFIASLAVLTTVASAAESQTEAEVFVLPTYVVTTPRYSPVEQRINDSLEELRQQAKSPVVSGAELCAVKALALPNPETLRSARKGTTIRVAAL